MMVQLECCGANGPSDWAGSKFNNAEKQGINLALSQPLTLFKLPHSCCSRPPGSEECKDLKISIAGPVYNDVFPNVSQLALTDCNNNQVYKVYLPCHYYLQLSLI